MKTKFGSKKKLPEDMALQITSMADIFVILLVFLLKTYSTTLVNISPSEGTALPEASSETQIKETLKIEVKSDEILVDQKSILKLKGFNFVGAEADEAASSPSEPLYLALRDQRRPNPIANKEPNLLVMADERTPYSTLERVLSSAAKAGFVDLQLVVVNPD